MDLVLFPWQEWFDVTVVNPLAAAQEVGAESAAKDLKYKRYRKSSLLLCLRPQEGHA